jgi:uncharacterized protein DUF6788
MNALAHKRQHILQQMEQIDCMEQGSLQSETRPSARDSRQQQGPYFKHQIWEQGRNVSRRIPADKAPALAKAIEGRKEFEKLAGQFVEATVAMTRAGASADSKKNGTKSRPRFRRKRPDTSSNS